MRHEIKLKLLSPLSHFGDERMGTMQVMRTMKFEYEGEYIDVPVFSGNAFRGILRRIAMRDYLDKIGISEEGISAKLYYMLFTGGALTSGAKYNEIGEKRIMREMCPPLALFGTALGDQIPQGKMKVGIFKPICKELSEYTGTPSEKSFYDMLQEVFYTRRDDLKSNPTEKINDETKHENAVQMKYEMQCLSAGTELVGSIVIENSSKLDESCLSTILMKFSEEPYIGGKSSAGHGEVEMFGDFGDCEKYYGHLQEKKDEIRAWLREIEANL